MWCAAQLEEERKRTAQETANHRALKAADAAIAAALEENLAQVARHYDLTFPADLERTRSRNQWGVPAWGDSGTVLYHAPPGEVNSGADPRNKTEADRVAVYEFATKKAETSVCSRGCTPPVRRASPLLNLYSWLVLRIMPVAVRALEPQAERFKAARGAEIHVCGLLPLGGGGTSHVGVEEHHEVPHGLLNLSLVPNVGQGGGCVAHENGARSPPELGCVTLSRLPFGGAVYPARTAVHGPHGNVVGMKCDVRNADATIELVNGSVYEVSHVEDAMEGQRVRVRNRSSALGV